MSFVSRSCLSGRTKQARDLSVGNVKAAEEGSLYVKQVRKSGEDE